MGKEKPPRAKARSRCSPSVVPPPLYSLAAAPFPKGGNNPVLSQDVRSCADIFSLVLDLVYTLGRDLRGMGLRPLPRIPTFSILLPPYPPPGPSFTVLWRGLGGQRRLSTPLIREVCGLAVSCPFPKNDNCSDGKGAVTSWVTRPIYSLVSYACKAAC